MARKQQVTVKERPARKQATKKQAAEKQAAQKTTTRRKKQPAPPPPPEREPWTPWGKWAKRRRQRIEQQRREREERRLQRRRARLLRRMRRRRITVRGGVFLGLIVLACVVGGFVLALLGRPYPWEALTDVTAAMRTAEALRDRQHRWDELVMNHYMVEATLLSTNPQSAPIQCGPTVIEVRNNQVVGSPGRSGEEWSPSDTCNSLLGRMIIDGAFDWLQGRVGEFQPGRDTLQANFDPDFGYPREVVTDVYRADDRSPECCWRATWNNLRPIND